MKVAVSASGTTLTSLVDPRFGRCPYFLIVDTDGGTVDAYPNENAGLQGGAGIQSARFIAEKGATAVITGRCGPNATLALEAASVTVYEAQGGIPVADAMEKLKNSELTASAGDVAPSPAGSLWPPGVGQWPSRGGGRGAGRGAGRGGGRGAGGRCGAGMGRGSRPGAGRLR